ncbi:MAG TPA: SDR family NAD(P)-dependent oxidoreductase [Pyrinomonadaceae bacterium]|nr:SDR family NAD(P)-dependent oxidoreductase [Pyrinomonadaceae bacterium]
MSESYRDRTPLPAELLRGRVAIVTGGSRGIGRATALRLAEAGADVVVNYARNEEAAEEVARLARAAGVRAIALRADVGSVREAEALVAQTLEHFGRVDLVVANAGVWEGAAVEEMTEELWDRVVAANLKGTWTVCRAAVPAMKRQGYGSIVIVSSTAGQRGEAFYSNYAASKGGQISFTKSLAAELAPVIRVNSVAPGWVDTEMNTGVFGDDSYRRQVTDAIPLKRVASADDVALSIVFLASDWARHITGEILNVNGGSVLCG